jgi:hypothetical protein
MMVARAWPIPPLYRRTRVELAQPFGIQALEHATDGRQTSFCCTSAGLHGRGHFVRAQRGVLNLDRQSPAAASKVQNCLPFQRDVSNMIERLLMLIHCGLSSRATTFYHRRVRCTHPLRELTGHTHAPHTPSRGRPGQERPCCRQSPCGSPITPGEELLERGPRVIRWWPCDARA